MRHVWVFDVRRSHELERAKVVLLKRLLELSALELQGMIIKLVPAYEENRFAPAKSHRPSFPRKRNPDLWIKLDPRFRGGDQDVRRERATRIGCRKNLAYHAAKNMKGS